MILLLAGLAFADPPTMCDPTQDTAPPTAGGYCLKEEEYADVGLLRKKVETLEVEKSSLEDEVVSFEQWQIRQESILKYTVDSMTRVHEVGVDLVVSTCQEDLEEANHRARRGFMERNGFGLGVGVGVVTTAVITGLVLKTYGNILDPD